MKPTLCILLTGLTIYCYAQVSEETFKVKKRNARPVNEKLRLFDLNVTPGIDTIGSYVWVNLAPLKPYYDSIALFNIKAAWQNDRGAYFQVTTVGSGGHAIMKFFQRQKDNTFKLVYIRNWVITRNEGKK
jgi:hypothetical protein